MIEGPQRWKVIYIQVHRKLSPLQPPRQQSPLPTDFQDILHQNNALVQGLVTIKLTA